MDTFSYFQIISLVLLYLLLIGRTIQLMIQGIKPFVLGIGEKGLKGTLEISFLIGLIIWSIEIIFNSLKFKYHILPDFFNSYLFEVVYFIGTWLIYSNLFFLLAAVLVLIGIHYQILQEEKYLFSKYGNEYENYMQKVRRYL